MVVVEHVVGRGWSLKGYWKSRPGRRERLGLLTTESRRRRRTMIALVLFFNP